MPFATDTKIRICLTLEIPVTAASYVETVQQALEDAYTQGGETVVTLIEGYLTQYETAQAGLGADTDNAGLIAAGSLRWSEGSKSSGFSDEMKRLRRLISNVLGLEGLSSNTGNRVQILRG